MQVVRKGGWVLLGMLGGAAICLALDQTQAQIAAGDLGSFASLTVFVMLLRSSHERWLKLPATT